MRWLCASLMIATLLLFPSPALHSAANSDSAGSALVIPLQSARLSSLDLEVGGELAGVSPGTTRYISRDALLSLPQATYTVTDPNFTGSTQVSGILLKDLFRHLGANPDSDLIVAICRDQYNGSYPRAYIAAHHPLLVLAING